MSACSAKQLPLVHSDPLNSLSNTPMKGEEQVSEIPYATYFEANEVAKIQKKSLISACGAEELPFVISGRLNSLSNTHVKGEESVSEMSMCWRRNLLKTPRTFQHGLCTKSRSHYSAPEMQGRRNVFITMLCSDINMIMITLCFACGQPPTSAKP